MESLLNSIDKTRESKSQKIIDSRMKDFSKARTDSELFNELCFCLMTANFNAERSIKIQDAIKDGFETLSKDQLAKKLKELGHRFPNARASYIAEARVRIPFLKSANREWLVNNVKGLGMKEASHFLRNIGKEDYAIIDFHIVDLLVSNGLIKRPKAMNKRVYLEIEDKLKHIAEKAGLSLGELDLHLWYLETGKILK